MTDGVNKAVVGGETKAPTGSRKIMYKGSDTSVNATWRELSVSFKRGVAREVPAAMAESLLQQTTKFTADLTTKLDGVENQGGK